MKNRKPVSKRHLRVVRSPRNILDIIQHMDVNHMKCRVYGHKWEPQKAREANEKRRQIFMEWVLCERCGSFKIRHITVRGHVLKNWYQYAEGYLIKDYGAMSASDRDKVRLAMVQMLASLDEAVQG